VPISSTNTRRCGSTFPATITRQAALSHLSRSIASTIRFLLKPILLISRPTVESLKILPVVLCRKMRLSETVAVGRSLTSSLSSLLVTSSVLGGLPPPLLGLSGSPRPVILRSG
jgi:hypothetical protein